MALYDSLFTMMDMTAAQLLVTAADFEHQSFRESLTATAEDLLEMNVIPIFNENDAVLSSRMPVTVRHQGLRAGRPEGPHACLPVAVTWPTVAFQSPRLGLHSRSLLSVA